MKYPLLTGIRWLSKLSFLVCILFTSTLSAQNYKGRPAITNYSYEDYGADPTNWWIVEGDNGIMYFANTKGVLEFDGVNWNLIELPDNNGVRSLSKAEDGTLYLSGEGDFGYLQINKKGSYEYVSLKEKIPEEHRNIETIWDTEIVNEEVFFRASDKMFIWDGEQIKVIVSEDGFHTAAFINGTHYVRVWNKGLCTIKNGEVKLVPGGEIFADERVYVIVPYDDKSVLLGTRTMGFYIYDGTDFKPFKTEIDDQVRGSIYIPGERLENGNFIINSFSNGTYLIDKDGKKIQEFIPGNGLQDGSVTYTYVDSRGVLWLALFNGISRVDLNSPFTFYDSNNGLETNVVWDIYKYNDILYIGSNNGLFYLEEGSDKIERMPGTSGQVYWFQEINGRLYSGSGDMGFFEVKGKSFEYIRQSVNYDFRLNFIIPSERDPKRLFTYFQGGIASFYFDDKKNQFVEESKIELPLPNIVFLKEYDNGSILVTNNDKGKVTKLNPKMDGKSMDLGNSEVSTYDQSHGLPNKYVFPMTYFDQTYYLAPNENPYQFNPETERFTQLENFFDIPGELRGVSYPRIDENGKMFYSLGDGVKMVFKNDDGNFIVNDEIFKSIKGKSIFSMFPEKPNNDGLQTVWLSGTDGIIRYEGNMESPDVSNFDLKIRNINIAGDSLIYGGAGKLPEQIDLAYDENTIVLGYAAPLYKGQNNVEYSTFLEGFDKKWSDWTKQTSREYINLPAGNYSFKAKARSLYGNQTDEIAIPFTISSPWYKTWWAYALYILGFLLLVLAIVRSRTSMLRQRQKELEDNVEARTKEVQLRLNELATVNTVSRALTEKLELNELIKMVGDEMKKLFNSDITYLAILDTETNIINFPYQDGDTMEPFKYGEGLTSKIIRTGEPLLINKDTDIKAEYDKLGVARTGKDAISYLGVPIPSEDQIIGVLSVQSTQQESRFNEEDMRLLNTIARNVGIAIHNAELYEEAKAAMAKAEDANEAKSAFLSTVSHELRTPLTSVLGFAKIIRKRLEDKIFPAVKVEDQKIKRTMQQVTENLNVVVSEGERLTNLINDVLDLAKIESGKMEWTMKPVFLQDAINRAIASTQSLFDNKEIALNKNIPSDLPLVSADEDKLIQVVINLLSNAVKFTDKGSVSIEAYLEKDQIIVEIQDTGIGISEEDKHKVFERFRQAGDTLTDKPKGTGLGLPICREIIEHHGGIIWMKSEAGVGSTFFFSIPALGEGVQQQPIQLDRILKSLKKQIKHSSLNTDLKYVPTILVVDDDTPIRSLLRQELGEAGYNVTEAANGKAALDMVRNSKPDLIILDVMMPEINGFDVAAVLKNDPATMDIPIIILSIVQDKERGFKIGVDRYLTKPINTEQLFSEVDALLEQGVSKKKVLVVDEDTSAVKSLSDVLSARGYKVMESNGQNMVQAATESQPDIIMLNSVYNGDQKIIRDLKQQKGMENVMFFIYE